MNRGETLTRDTTHARHLVVVDLVVDLRERQRELVVRVADVGEVGIHAGHQLRREVDVQAAFVRILVHDGRRIATTRVVASRMRVGLLSDVHGNLPALEAVLEACSIRTDVLWCLGDARRLRRQPERVRRAGARAVRARAGGEPRPGRDRPRRLHGVHERRRPRDPVDAGGAVGRRRGVAGRASAERRARAGRPLPRLAARPDLGVRRRRRRRRSTRCRGRRTSWSSSATRTSRSPRA